ncbi:hypothetical protein CEP52_015238 [Fusarium oligoseptatum]|uniref:Uncharacterized protein n=1 Tax=Fusarium oligoseptatum TaxID=2604345 RepID=A0A428SEZ6_9HYPO|nr:hypothetical protein CEP52_015238 [Fusarium oligoseptatum]
MLLRDEDPWDSRTRVLDSYNKSLQNNWVDVTHYRCTVSVLGRLYLIATLEHTLFLNRNEKGGVLGPGLKLLQPVTILSIACILLQGLACSWFMQEKDDDDDDDTHLDLFQWLLSTANQPGTVLGSLANSISFDRQILSTYFNMRGASSTRGIHPGLNQMLVRSRQELRRQTRRLAREAKNVMPLPNELAIWISSIVMDMALSVLAALAAALVLIVSRGSPLPVPSHQLIQLAALSGAVKAGLANATSLLCKASASNFASIVLFLISSPVVSLAVVAVLAQKILGDVPVSLVNASLIASLPLILSQSMMLPTFYITDDRTFLLLLFDALGGYTLTKVAHGSGLAISVSPWQGVLRGVMDSDGKLRAPEA